MGIGFVVLLPFVFWIFIIILIIVVSKSGVKTRRPAQSARRTAVPTVRMSGERPKIKDGLFDMNLDGEKKKSEKRFSLNDLLGKTGFDKYETKGRKKDFVSGYDRTINVKKARHMQFSHTYDGHEPWDDCLPKEKDPWDKDFYA